MFNCSANCRHRGTRAAGGGNRTAPADCRRPWMNPLAADGLDAPPELAGCVTTLQNSNTQAAGIPQLSADPAASSIARRAPSCSGQPDRCAYTRRLVSTAIISLTPSMSRGRTGLRHRRQGATRLARSPTGSCGAPPRFGVAHGPTARGATPSRSTPSAASWFPPHVSSREQAAHPADQPSSSYSKPYSHIPISSSG